MRFFSMFLLLSVPVVARTQQGAIDKIEGHPTPKRH